MNNPKQLIIISVITVAVIGVGVLLSLTANTSPDQPVAEGDIVSNNGVHWHSKLTIFIKGQQVEIPANIGAGAAHQPFHTHDTTGELHLEKLGVVSKNDTKLGKFFEIWGQQFNATCVLDQCGGKVVMTVNGKENTDFENYLIQDQDVIEVRYE